MNLKEILYTSRLPNTGDIEAFLWYKCNLNCRFCKQPHTSNDGLSIESLQEKCRVISKFVTTTTCPKYIVTILGGELFGDFVDDILITEMLLQFSSINNKAKLNNKHVEFGFSSNLIFNNVARVKTFLEILRNYYEVHSQFCISYDLIGRDLNKEQLELFKKNESELSEFIDVWNFNLTVDNCMALVNGYRDDYFEYLYETYPVTPSVYYDYEQTWGKPEETYSQRPSELLVLEAIKVLDKKYPRSMSKWREQSHMIKKSSLTCPKQKITILPDNSIKYCLENNSCGNGDLMLKMAEQKGCLACKYLDYCQQDCMHAAIDNNIEQIKPCLQQAIYDHLKETPL